MSHEFLDTKKVAEATTNGSAIPDTPSKQMTVQQRSQPRSLEEVDAALQMTIASPELGNASVIMSEGESKRILRKIDLNLMPLMCLTYGLNYLDKTALSYASIMGLLKDSKLSTNEYQWLGSLFYFGYLAFELPTSRLLQWLPLGKYTAINVILWGVTLCCMAATVNFPGIAAVRFLLGMFEATITPSFVLITSQWYRQSEQGTRTGVWFSFNGFANVIGGLIAYGIAKESKHHRSAIDSWKVIFLIWGSLTALVGLVMLAWLPDSPCTARFLTLAERRLVLERTRPNQQGIGNRRFKWYQFQEALQDPQTWAFVLFALLWDIPNGGVSNFFSQLVVSFGFSPEQSLLYACPAGAIAASAILINGYLGQIFHQRILISMVGLLVAIFGMGLIVGLPMENKNGRLAGYYLLNTATVPFVTLLGLISSNVAGYTKKITVAGLFLVCYCTGNIIGPQTFNAKEAPIFKSAEITILACWGLCVIDLLLIWWYYRFLNRKKQTNRSRSDYTKLTNSEWLDLTDKENPELIYQY